MPHKLKHYYIAGPMSNLPKHNYPAFFKAEKRLNKFGIETVNPARLNVVGDPWNTCLRNDIIHIMKQCKGVALLKHWFKSKGARLELFIALQLGMDIIDAQTLKPINIIVNPLFKISKRNKQHEYHWG